MRDIITILTVIINVVAMFSLIAGVLLHSGQGGGLSDMLAAEVVLGSVRPQQSATSTVLPPLLRWCGCSLLLHLPFSCQTKEGF